MFVPFAHIPEFITEEQVSDSVWVEARLEAFDNIAHLAYERHKAGLDISGGFDHAGVTILK